MERIVLAYSGGLDTSVAIPWLAEQLQRRGHRRDDGSRAGRELEDVRDRALATGAVRAHVLDVREEFARDYILPALKADAIYEDRYPLATALGRPLIAQKLVEIARDRAGDRRRPRLHGTGNDQVALDVDRARAQPDADGHRAGARLGHDAPERSSTRTRGVPCRT